MFGVISLFSLGRRFGCVMIEVCNNLSLYLNIAKTQQMMNLIPFKLKNLFLLLCLFIQHISYSQNIDLSYGLKAYYSFSGNAFDESGNGLDGLVYGGTSLTTDRFNNPNSAYEFDGLDDYINTFSTFDFENRSLSVWVNPYDVTGSGSSGDATKIHVAITQDHYNLQNGILRVDIDDGQLKLWAGGNTGTYSSQITENKWYHLVLIREGINTRYYINGEFVFSGSSDGYGSTYNPNSDLIIGGGRSTFNQFFKGKIDDIRIYNRALNDCEINFLFSEDEIDLNSNLVAHFPFNGNAMDNSGNQHDGVLFGDPEITTDRFGNPNSAYEFDGLDDYINTFSTFDFENRSLSVWINPYDVTGSGSSNNSTKINVAITQDHYNLNNGILRVDIDDGQLKLWAGGNTGTYSSQLTENQWYHLVLVREGIYTKYYINGEFVFSGSSDGYGSTYNPNSDFIIGGGRSTFNQFFKGKIDDIRIYDKALNECEINSLFNRDIAVSIDQVDLELDVVFYPNPVIDYLKIQNNDNLKLDVEILDNLGRIISKIHVNDSYSLIDFSNYSSGVYFVRLISNDKFYIAKLLKQ